MKTGVRNVVMGIVVIILLSGFSLVVSATSENPEVTGKFYEFDKDSHYEFHKVNNYKQTPTDNTYGTFYIKGNVAADDHKSDVPSYEVAEGDLSIFYDYKDTKLNADEDAWHLIDDKTDKVADIKLDSDIMKGAIILQTSKDRKNWVNVQTIYNAFSDTPIRTDLIYSATDVELINGCFYRVIIAYELSIRTENHNFLFINTDKYDYKKCAEVYEFYAYTDSGEKDVVDYSQTYNLGKKVRVKNFDGYFGEELIKQGDSHYGWELGNFFVSGYTDKVVKDDGSVVFLKNVGDKVTLWFNLIQNINSLNENDKLSITTDTKGYDQYFETPKMNFGRGVLIIRYTDHNNVKEDPIIYTNYLEANASFGADTKVQLFEEGDYEVALDYEVTSDELIDKVGHYRIFFKFSVRNGNCMVYPFDVATGSELTNSATTADGFRLDLAKSRYLKINIKREILKDSADGLAEDTRFNGAAKDGAEYTDEGIYTITVSNEYTGQLTTKKIYVGTNNVLRAHMITGLSISEINNLVIDGATISEDGTIQPATIKTTEQPTQPDNAEKDEPKTDETETPSSSDVLINIETQIEDPEKNTFPISIFITIGAVVLIVISIPLIKKKKNSVNTDVLSNDNEGGTEQ